MITPAGSFSDVVPPSAQHLFHLPFSRSDYRKTNMRKRQVDEEITTRHIFTEVRRRAGNRMLVFILYHAHFGISYRTDDTVPTTIINAMRPNYTLDNFLQALCRMCGDNLEKLKRQLGVDNDDDAKVTLLTHKWDEQAGSTTCCTSRLRFAIYELMQIANVCSDFLHEDDR